MKASSILTVKKNKSAVEISPVMVDFLCCIAKIIASDYIDKIKEQEEQRTSKGGEDDIRQ